MRVAPIQKGYLPAEDERHGKGQVGKITGFLGCFLTSYSHDGKGGGEDHEQHDVQPHERTSFVDGIGGDSVSVVSDWVVPTEEQDRADKDRPKYFDQDVREDKDLPRVYLGGSFSNFVQTSLGDELRHDLLNELREHGE